MMTSRFSFLRPSVTAVTAVQASATLADPTMRPRSNDPETSDILAALSSPVTPELLRGPDLGRRRFLQAAGLAGAATLLPGWLAEAATAATPLGARDGVLVLITLAGGNDGLNTFIPVTDGAYHDARGSLAISPSSAIALNGQRALHPNLGLMKTMWDRGQLAVIEGVGRPDNELSHFVSMAQVMAANGANQPGTSGWLGRILDGMGADPLNGVAIGSNVPLLVQGSHHRASAIPHRANDLRQIDASEPVDAMWLDALSAMGAGPTGLGSLSDSVAVSMRESIGLAGQLRPLFPGDSDEDKLTAELRLAARLINANLGIRIISVTHGSYDSHANQLSMHGDRMRELNAGLAAFYETLSPGFADRTLVVGTSEFGRRVRANQDGTDHGTANAAFVIGTRVNGGFFGQAPSLTDLDSRGNLRHHVDYRNLYANLATTWLGADAAQVFGRDWGDLGFLRAPGGISTGSPGQPAIGPTPRTMRAEVARLYLAYFLRQPDEAGLEHWIQVRRSGLTLGEISTEFAASAEFRARYGSLDDHQFVDLVYRNVLQRPPDAGGLAHWISVLGRGTSRGQMMIGFSESTEFRERTASEVSTIETTGPVGRLYRAYFGREPDENGLAHWLDSGLPIEAISEQFAQSSEFRQRYGSLDDRGFVITVYRNVLGREPDADGLAHWESALGQGARRGSVMTQFSNSQEFVQAVRG